MTMRKAFISLVLVFTIVLFVFYSCDDVVQPEADFIASQFESDGYIYVNFSDMSSNNPSKWEWTFEGGFPKTSEEKNPTIVYKEPGVFDVTLVVSNEAGENKIIKYAFVNVARFINTMVSDAEVTLGDQIKTLKANTFIQILTFEKYITNCYIETSGRTPNGESSGLILYWEIEVDLTKYYFYKLAVSPELIFVNITNSSNFGLNPFHVNCGNSTYESLENILIPNNGTKYGIGYYYAIPEMEIRAYYPYGYVYWKESTHFSLPRTNNQSISIFIEGTLPGGSIENPDQNLLEPIVDTAFFIKSENKPKTAVILQSGTK